MVQVGNDKLGGINDVEHKERIVQVPKRINKTWKDLNVTGLKLYYYIIHKFQIKALAIRNATGNYEIDDFEIYEDSIDISWNELGEYLKVKRLDYRNIDKAIYDELKELFCIKINYKKRCISIDTNSYLIHILREVDVVQKNDVINLDEISMLKDANTIKFYLYCNTFRYYGQQTININSLKIALQGNDKQADKTFYDKLIISSKKIYEILGIYIRVSKRKDNLYIEFNK